LVETWVRRSRWSWSWETRSGEYMLYEYVHIYVCVCVCVQSRYQRTITSAFIEPLDLGEEIEVELELGKTLG